MFRQVSRIASMPRRARWAIPAGAFAMTGGIMASALVASAQPIPVLPSRTPAQLIAQVLRSQSHEYSGTIVQSTSLGLPALPASDQNPMSLPGLLSGSHTISVWRAGPGKFRLSMPNGLSESDIYGDGTSLWLWQSSHETATKLSLSCNNQAVYSMGVPHNGKRMTPPPLSDNAIGTVEAHPVTGKPYTVPVPGPNMLFSGVTAPAGTRPGAKPGTQQIAAALAALGRSTKVSVGTNATIAGRAAYNLQFQPKDTRSLVGSIMIAIDADNGMILRQQIFARNSSSPAISAGFTRLSLTPPATGDVTFTPPRGATVHNAGPGCGGSSAPAPKTKGSAGVIGGGWLTVAKFPRSVLNGLTTGGSAGPPPNTPAGALNPAGGEEGVLNALLKAATPVSGAWGSGSLVRSSLVSMLFTGDSVYVGAVQPSVLYAAAGQHGQ